MCLNGHVHVLFFLLFCLQLRSITSHVSLSQKVSLSILDVGRGITHISVCLCDTADSSSDPSVHALSAACTVKLTARPPF